MKRSHNLTILLVDDDADLLQYWSATLGQAYQRVLTAMHAYEGLEVLHREKPDMILADASLPEMDGFALCQEIKRHPAFFETPVVLYKSGYLTLEDKQAAARCGADHILSKPASVKEVACLLQEIHSEIHLRQVVRQGELTVEAPLPEDDYADFLTRRLGQTIAQLKREQQSLNLALNRFKDFANCVGHFFWETDADGVLRFLSAGTGNPLALPTFGFENAPFDAFFEPYFDSEGLQAVREDIRAERAVDRYLRQQGDEALRVVHVIGQPFYSREGQVSGYRGTLVDVTDVRAHSERLFFEAHHDALTGLYNARAFRSLLGEELYKLGADEQHVLCYIDLDYFKAVNDSAGHRAGDALLARIGELFRKQVRSNDILGRLGGDEFAILLRHCSLDQARRLVQQLHNTVSTFRFQWEGRSHEIGLSIGLLEVRRSELTAQEVLDLADQACYAAKRAGRNQIQVYGGEAGTGGQLSGDALWLEKFHRAVNRNDLCLFRQPICRAYRPTRPVAWEVLVRLRDGDRLVAPKYFLSIIDRYQLFAILDRWVVNRILDWLERDELGTLGEFYSINLSGQSLCDTDFRQHVRERLRDNPAAGQRLCFEITESSAIQNLANAIEFIADMRSLGCRFALDDFGTGFSSLAHLRNLPVDFVKLDGLFVKGVTSDPVDLGLVQSVQQIAGLMGIRTIAEYVENDETALKLREIGIDYLQGFHVGHPEMMDFLPDRSPLGNALS